MFTAVGTAGLNKPADGQHLNYIHVLFEWDQEPDARYYQLELTEVNSGLITTNDSINTTLYIDTAHINWDETYTWRIRGYNSENIYGNWKGPLSFSTMNAKMGTIIVTNYQDSLVQNGLTFFGGPNPGRHSLIIDKYGNEVWNDAEFEFKINYIDEFGSIYGNSDYLFPLFTSCKINYDMEFLWNSNQICDPHDLKESPSKTYFALRNIFSLGPIPSDNAWTQQFRDLGFLADDTTNEFSWYGQEIVEFDKNSEIVWSWDPFDHFTMADFDNHGHTWNDAYLHMEYDWNHSNAIFFDEIESAIYLSVRHLSRITKIGYPSGEIIYNISLPPPYISSGESYIGNDLLFSFQHHVEKLDNGNLTFFDNGNISDLIFGQNQRISRALEIEVIGDTACNIVWEYSLPPNLFGHAGGSVQILDNDNILIYTRGNGGGTLEPSILEVTRDQEIVWKMTGTSIYAWYRAFRIPSLHPDAFSLIANQYLTIPNMDSTLSGINFNSEDNFISFTLYNESDYGQPYLYTFKDNKRWFNTLSDTVYINKKDSLYIHLDLLTGNDNRRSPFTNLDIYITPIKHPYSKKILKLQVYDLNRSESLINQFQGKAFENYPNPFNPVTTISYDLPKESLVSITIYDMLGNKVKTLINAQQRSGYHTLNWDATNNFGGKVSAGMYIYTIQAGEFRQAKKMVLLK